MRAYPPKGPAFNTETAFSHEIEQFLSRHVGSSREILVLPGWTFIYSDMSIIAVTNDATDLRLVRRANEAAVARVQSLLVKFQHQRRDEIARRMMWNLPRC